MKKGEMLVSMPMSTYEELMLYKEKYENLTMELTNCFSKNLDNNTTEVYFSVKNALNAAEKFKPIQLRQYPTIILT